MGKPMRVLSALAGVLALVVAFTAPPRAAAQANADRLEAAIARYVEGPRGGGRRGLTPLDFYREMDADVAILREVEAVGREGLSLEQDIDRRLLAGLLRTDLKIAERRAWRNDPSMYVPSGQVGRLVGPDATGAPAERARRLIEFLDGLPATLEQGRKNLGRPPKRFTDEAIFQTDTTLITLREGIAALDPQVEIDLAAAAALGVTALEGYLEFLRGPLLLRSSGSWAIGREAYDYLLRERMFLDADADADEILARGWRAFEETEALAQQVADRMSPGSSWVEVYERLKDDHPVADEIKAAYQAQMDAAQRFVREHRVVTLPDGEHVITVDTPPAQRRSSPFGTFQPVSASGTNLQGRLVLTPVEDWITPEQRVERLRSHHRAWIPIIAVHEAYPGHHVQALKLRENPRALRRRVREPIFSEGWGLFTEELMFELGFLQGDDVRLTVLRNRLWRAARVILDVSLHTGQMTLDEAVDFMVERVRFERYAAELEVGMYPRRPTYVLGYLIGMQEIEKIRAEWIQRHGVPNPPSELYDRLLRIGSIPPALVREELLAGAGRR
jgi:uncharacterized protein (DUF885 family)